MKRLAERALLGSLVGGLLFAGAACSASGSNNTSTGSSAGAPAGTAGASSAAAGANSFGGNTSVGAGAPGVSTAGAVGTATGGTTGAAGGVGTAGTATVGTAGGAGTAGAGAAGAPAVCPTDTNIVNTPSCWVGCDPTLTTDNPQGVQGAFYTFGDGTSCPATAADPVCDATKGVCLAGTTKVDSTYAAYGCAIGLELNSTGGTAPTKQPYTGPAKCFNYALTGDSGGNEVRISFTQSADTSGMVSPYVSVPAFTNGKTGTVCTKDVSCQGMAKCALGTAPYDIQFEVVGGNHAGTYNVCLSSLTPVADGTSTLSQLCGAQGSANGTADVSKYFVQNNLFPGTASNKICVTPKAATSGAGYTVDSTVFATGANLNAYPSVVDGWHYGRVSSDTALPKQVSTLASVNSSVSYTGSDGKYDASYDIWVLPDHPATAPTSPSGGLEVMIWLNDSGVSPSSSNGNMKTTTTTINGASWDVWVSTVMDWNYVAYVKTGQTSFTGDLKPFITDAVSRKGLQKSGSVPWLYGIEFGFELYDAPPSGFAVTSFSADVK